MNDLVRQQKQDYLAGLKNARATVEQKVAVRESEIFSQKLTIVQDQERQLDEALDKFILSTYLEHYVPRENEEWDAP